MPIKMNQEQQEMASELFKLGEDKREGKTRLTIRFNTATHDLYKATGNRTRLRGAALLRYVEEPARTPSGGRYVRRALTVRTQDGRLWHGNVKNGTDTVILRLAPKESETD